MISSVNNNSSNVQFQNTEETQKSSTTANTNKASTANELVDLQSAQRAKEASNLCSEPPLQEPVGSCEIDKLTEGLVGVPSLGATMMAMMT